MGGVVKKLVGGGSKKESSTQTQSGTTTSYLMNNANYKAASDQAMAQIGNINITPQQLAEMPAAERSALTNLMNGQDYDYLQNAQKFMSGYGTNLLNSGQQQVSGATDILSRLQNLDQSDYQAMLKSEMNNDLVNSQIKQATSDINDYTAGQISNLNLNAAASGNMGSSRAGVAQGVIVGQGAKAVGSASVQYRTAEEQNAQNRLMSYLNLQSNTAGQLAGIGQNQVSMGMGAYNSGVGYGSQYTAGQLQNNQNAVNAGNMIRTYNQQQLDLNRNNQMLMSAPALARLGYANQYLLPMATLSQTSNGTATTTQNVSKPGMLPSLMSAGGMAAGGYFSNAMGMSTQQGMGAGGTIGGLVGNMFTH
ncbi:hypothetical protein GEM21_05455 [Salmonella enterica]|nr:hypothetical protein [Salmonella enterica]EEO2148458.1 hypothetical protein [Salmonella enterica]EIL8912094.1 hypothetical protein [Salmonella enterica]